MHIICKFSLWKPFQYVHDVQSVGGLVLVLCDSAPSLALCAFGKLKAASRFKVKVSRMQEQL